MEGNIAWVLISTALVLFMIPGLAFFYGGMVRSKNFLAMLMQNFFAMGLLAVLWALIGYSIAFGNFGDAGWFGGFDHIGLKDVGMDDSLGLGIPVVLFAAFQMTFAMITPALITGATADRLKFAGYAIFIAAWLLLVYSPVAHWAFGGGWIADMGALDFAGGAVVHINAGAAALAMVILVGARKGHGTEPMPPHALPWTLLGTGILWFGWFGFNAGSALGANGVAAQALMNTILAPAAAMLGASIMYPVRGAVTWKSVVGTNVASDALSNLSSPGVMGGALIVVGEDYGEGASVIQERTHAFAMKSSMCTSPRWARPPAPWPAWSPSRRAPASSAPCRRSSSASSPVPSATWRCSSRRP